MKTVDKTVPMARPSRDDHDTLAVGTRLHEFEVLRVLGIGGFGVVYLAMDHTLQRQVAIKEYMPAAFVARADGAIVSLRSASYAETFQMGLHSFINEARLLAQFDHPSLVKVHRFWEGNGTAYMAMPYYAGRTLKDERRAMDRPPDEAWLRGVIDPLLDALEVLHSADVYHRDISPDNILMLPDRHPVLLDFGAARRVIGDRTQTLTAILKPNYAPVEQYPDAGMRQGPWTDLYALAAVARFMLTGQSPPPSAARAVRDDMRALAEPGNSRPANGSASFLSAIDWALAVRPQDRPHSVQVFRDALNGEFMPPRASSWMSFESSTPEGSSAAGASEAATEANRTRFARAARDTNQRPQAGPVPAGARWRPHVAAAIAAVALGLLAAGLWTQNARVTHAAGTSASEPSWNVAPHRSLRPAQAADSQASGAGQHFAALQSSPRQVCAERGTAAMPMCMSRECRRPYFREHPQCLQLQRESAARQQAQMTR